MAHLIETLRSLAKRLDNAELKAAVIEAEAKMQQYYYLGAMSTPVIMATMCDPRYGMGFFSWAKTKGIAGEGKDEEITANVCAVAAKVFKEYHDKFNPGPLVSQSRRQADKQVGRNLRQFSIACGAAC
jgi:hypothetical protein